MRTRAAEGNGVASSERARRAGRPVAPGVEVKFYAGDPVGLRAGTPNLTPLLQAQFQCSPEERFASRLPVLVSSPSEADIVALPRVWSHYVAQRNLDEPHALAQEASRAGKPILVWHTGDLTPIVPFSNCVVLTSAVGRLGRPKGWHVAPRFIDDPLPRYASGRVVVRGKAMRPRVGFCGYAAVTAWKVAYSVLHGLTFRITSAFGSRMYEPAPLLPATLLRAKVLRTLERSASLDTQFVVRSRFKGGARGAGQDHPTVIEFYENILNTDYTVCMRGYGNWSIRFYETLACGRIPIFIDTECGLPFDATIDWRRYCVWVPVGEVARVGDYVTEFHNGLSDAKFRARQRECRELWESRLTLKGFVSHLHEHLSAEDRRSQTF